MLKISKVESHKYDIPISEQPPNGVWKQNNLSKMDNPKTKSQILNT